MLLLEESAGLFELRRHPLPYLIGFSAESEQRDRTMRFPPALLIEAVLKKDVLSIVSFVFTLQPVRFIIDEKTWQSWVIEVEHSFAI